MIEFCITHLNPTTINTIGLLFDILGAILLWKFGLPQEISRSGSICLALEQENKEEKEKAILYDKFGNFGILLLIVGFIFQAISNFI